MAREQGLQSYTCPVGMWIWRKLRDVERNIRRHRAEVCDYKALYRKIGYPDGNWKILNRGQMARIVGKNKPDKIQNVKPR